MITAASHLFNAYLMCDESIPAAEESTLAPLKAYMAEQERQKEIEQFRQMMEKWERQQELNERFQK